MIRFLPYLVELALLIFCVIDLIQSPEGEIRNLPKWAWLILIIILPLVGCIAWLVAGRPVRVRPAQSTWATGAGLPEPQRPQPKTDDIDARLQADLAEADRRHEEALQRWQASLEERERKLAEQERPNDPQQNP
jgi:hypothetical protein